MKIECGPTQAKMVVKIKRSREFGFTLIELLVVLVILTLLASLVGPRLLDQLGGAKTKSAKIQISEIEQAMDIYKLDTGRYPLDSEGLQSLIQKPSSASGWNGPYLKKALPADPWGGAYQYKSAGRNGSPDIFSLGADGKVGGEGDAADIYN